VYGFNPLIPLDLLPLPLDDSLFHRDGEAKASFVKKLHAKVKNQLGKKMEHYARMANKKKKPMVFAPGDWVWVHFRKERFPNERKSKLHPRGGGPFQVVEKINNNAYRIDLQGEHHVSSTFNVCDLSPFDVGTLDVDSRSNPLYGGEDDVDLDAQRLVEVEDIEEDPKRTLGEGPLTRSKKKKMEALVHDLLASKLELHKDIVPKYFHSFEIVINR
jgi:hypothetical protein